MMKNQTMKMHQMLHLNKNNRRFLKTHLLSKISNSQSEKECMDIWALEMEHYLEYIDIDVWKKFKLFKRKERLRILAVLAIPKGAYVKISRTMDEQRGSGKHLELVCSEGLEKGYLTDSKQLLSQLEKSSWSESIHRRMLNHNKSSTNKVKSGFTGAYSTCTPSTSSTNVPEKEAIASFADEVIYSLFAKQSEDWDLLHEDLE
ncbi:hypothetical protein Tco_0525561 [Tanacetum coccineum]